jgi:hypothetical protein
MAGSGGHCGGDAFVCDCAVGAVEDGDSGPRRPVVVCVGGLRQVAAFDGCGRRRSATGADGASLRQPAAGAGRWSTAGGGGYRPTLVHG